MDFKFLNLQFVFLLYNFIVFCTNGLYQQTSIKDNVRLRDVRGDDHDISYSEHLENSIKNVQSDYKTNTLKIICRLQPCSDWSSWTKCGSLVGRRGVRSRTRECGSNVELCEKEIYRRIDQSEPCIIHIPWCPLQYNYTRHGFCVKLYGNQFKSWYDAQIQCESDGGNLINIDTRTLSSDIDEVFGNSDLLSIYAWIDGIKRASDKSWEFKSGFRTPTFSNWHMGQSRAENIPSCKCVIRSGENQKFEWRSSSICGNRENFICQIKN